MAGLSDEAGAYRSVPVMIGGSDYSPPGPEAVPGEMTDFGSWLARASTPGDEEFASLSGLIAAATAHTWFVTITPLHRWQWAGRAVADESVAHAPRLPIAIISKEDRLRYYDALELSQASVLTPLMVLLAECIEESLEEYEVAAQEQREQAEWAESLAEKFTQPERVRARNEFEVWKNAMELLKSYMHQTVDLFTQAADLGNAYLKDFGNLEFESTRRSGTASPPSERGSSGWTFAVPTPLRDTCSSSATRAIGSGVAAT